MEELTSSCLLRVCIAEMESRKYLYLIRLK